MTLESIDDVPARLARSWPAMRWLDRAGQEFDEAVVNFSIRRARDHAGLTAVTLAPLSSTARQAQIRTVDAAMAAHGGGFR